MCLASTGWHALPSTSEHDPDGMSDALLGDLLPQLGEGLSQLMSSLWCEVGAVEAAKQATTELALANLWRSVQPRGRQPACGSLAPP